MFFLMQGTQEDFKQYVAQEDNHYQAYIEEDNHEIEQFKELQHQNKKGPIPAGFQWNTVESTGIH